MNPEDFPRPEQVTLTRRDGLVIPVHLRYVGPLSQQCAVHTMTCRIYQPVIEGNLKALMPDVIRFDALSWPDGSHLQFSSDNVTRKWAEQVVDNSPVLRALVVDRGPAGVKTHTPSRKLLP